MLDKHSVLVQYFYHVSPAPWTNRITTRCVVIMVHTTRLIEYKVLYKQIMYEVGMNSYCFDNLTNFIIELHIDLVSYKYSDTSYFI